MGLIIRPIEQNDAVSCGMIGYDAHRTVSSAHGYPSEQPSEEFAIGLIKQILSNPNSWGVLAERECKVLGSIFLHKFPPSPVAVIGPLTVHPSAEGGGIGRMLMDSAIAQARKQNHDQIRLVQSPSHIRSFVLYTKSGFALREPLFLMQGQPLKDRYNHRSNANVRQVRDDNDISVCNELCKSAYGFSRETELRQAFDQGFATMIEGDGGVITGYAAGIGIFGHAVAKSNEDLKTLIANASAILGPGFFAPARNYEIIRWLLENGFQIGWPANLMTIGTYQEPLTPFLPSLAY
jgi:N-acetylglutamate synthase-like GNAT family acetyltransferase